MANSSYDIDQVVRLWSTFRSAGVPTDPATITLQVEDPSGNEDSYTYGAGTVSRHSLGVYYKDITVDEAGKWTYKYVGTGAVGASNEKTFDVNTSVF